jgi:hypothetical protein
MSARPWLLESLGPRRPLACSDPPAKPRQIPAAASDPRHPRTKTCFVGSRRQLRFKLHGSGLWISSDQPHRSRSAAAERCTGCCHSGANIQKINPVGKEKLGTSKGASQRAGKVIATSFRPATRGPLLGKSSEDKTPSRLLALRRNRERSTIDPIFPTTGMPLVTQALASHCPNREQMHESLACGVFS